ncbi:MAG: FG-GAP repeat protein, partial [Planctomycetota bacterium]
DGTRIVITAPAQVLQEFDRGSAYIWVSTGSTWTLEQRIVAGDPTAQFGDSAAIEGDRVLIGAPQDTTFGYFTGVVFFFERSGSTWVQSQRFYEAGANAGHHFGAEISMSGDVAVISAKGNAIFGGAHVYRHDGIRWRHEQRLVPVKGYFLGHFGSAVATDGELVVVGDSDGDSRKGLVNTFRLDGETWSQIVQARSGNPANDDYLGASVAIARNTVVSGAPGYNGNQGTVLTFPADEHLDLELEPSEPVAGEPFQATVVYGNQGDRVLLAAKLPQGPPFGLLVLAHGTFDSSSRFSTEWRAPMAMTGVSIDFFGYGLGVCGTVEKTEVVSVTF